jgi:hypothetical protein
MSPNAYVLINVEPERIQEVVELEADTEEDLTGILRHDISSIQGVTNAVPCIWYVRDVSGHARM